MDIGSTLLSLFVNYVAPPLLTALGALAVAALNQWRKRMIADGKLSTSEAIYDRIAQLALLIVTDLQSTLRPQIEAAVADGRLTSLEKTRLKEFAIDWVVKQLGPEGVKAAQDLLGIGFDELRKLIGANVETRLLAIKRGLEVSR